MVEHSTIINQYKDDIRQLEDKLAKAREKKRILVQRHVRARRKKQAQEEIRRMDNYETVAKFDELENRIERMEAEADLVNGDSKTDLEDAFDHLMDDDIEKELAALKSAKTENTEPPSP
jgi:phage shock protein A